MIKISPKGSNDINGILHRFPFINASCEAKSYQQDSSQCINAINISHDHHFCSLTSENEWFSFHIPNIKIFATHYSVQVPERKSDFWGYPVSWDFYGIDGEKSVLIDHVDHSSLTPTDRIKTFELDTKGYFSKFKLVMLGENDLSGSDLRIYKIDVFGRLYSFLPFIQTPKSYTLYILSSFLFIIL